MSDPIIITRSELTSIIADTIERIGKRKDSWISQNQASKLIGRRRLETAMRNGNIEFYKSDPEQRMSRVLVSRKDLEKYINRL